MQVFEQNFFRLSQGVRVDIRANYAAHNADADLTSENIEQAIEALDKVTEQDVTATESQLYSWRRARDALKRAARRVMKIAPSSARIP